MSYLKVTLTWAIPVEVDVFGAHLEAYVSLLPTFKTLRLSNKFGKNKDGTAAAISKIPMELLEMIEGNLIADERADALPNWKHCYRCFSGKCQPLDHFEPEELVQMYQDASGFDETAQDTADYPDTLTVDQRNQVARNLDEDDWMERHKAATDNWTFLAGRPASPFSYFGYFSQQHGLFHRHFKLHPWIAHPVNYVEHEDERYGQLEDRATIAYITLRASPSARHAIENSQVTLHDYDDEDARPTENLISRTVSMPQPLPESKRKDFAKVMRVLGLKPHPHTAHQKENFPLKSDFEDPVRTKDERVDDEPEVEEATAEDDSWPKLTMLVAHHDWNEF